MCLIVVLIFGAIALSVVNVISLKEEQRQTRDQQDALKKEKAQLEKELSEINNKENIEDSARDQLRLIKKGEKLYIFPEEITEYDKNKDIEESTGTEE